MSRITVIAATALLSAGTVFAPLTQATAAESTIRVSAFLHRAERAMVDLPPIGASVGDIASAKGTASLTRSGATVGSYVWTGTAVMVDAAGVRETRLSTYRVGLNGGSVYLQGFHDVPAGGFPDRPGRLVITGGDGAYLGAIGVAVMRQLVPNSDYRVDIRIIR